VTSATALFTIGYEKTRLPDFVAALEQHGIARVIDVREVPWSRRPEYAKSALGTRLARAGIEYVHLRGLGTPKPGREAVRSGDLKSFEAIFRAHMGSAPAQTDLARAVALAVERPSCLLCFERDPARCHRSIVAAALVARTGQTIVPLLP